MHARHWAILVAALLLSGCAAQESGSTKLTGEAARVAKVVDELGSSARTKKADEICERLLTPALAKQVAAGGSDCTDELTKAIDDADDYVVDVRAVKVTGSTATARVEDGTEGFRTLELVREGADWRISSFG